jgi:hypothetical protein
MVEKVLFFRVVGDIVIKSLSTTVFIYSSHTIVH